MSTPPPLPTPPPEIHLFPNSGHHYEFIPLPQSLLAATDVLILCKLGSGWKPVPDMKWIRVRFGCDDTSNYAPGVWVAIESNLGPLDRGFTWEPEKPIAPEPLPVGFNPNATPYAAHATNNLPPAPQPIKWSALLGSHLPPAVASRTAEIAAHIVWKRPAVTAPCDVDLIVDFGNTRTVALLLAQSPPKDGLSSICHAVRFQSRGENYMPS